MRAKKLLSLVLAIVLTMSVVAVSAAVDENFSSGSYDASKWTLYPPSDGKVKMGVQAGQASALCIETGDTPPTAATAAQLYADYGANGAPMYYEYDFSFTNNTAFQIRGGSSKGNVDSFFHAFSIHDNMVTYRNPSTGTWDKLCPITPDVVHTFRFECYTQHKSGLVGKTVVYLDGEKIVEYARAENPKSIHFLVTSANSQLKIYRVARLSNHPNANYRYYCERFDGETMDTLKTRPVTEADGWTFPDNGHTVSIATDNAEVNYLKMDRTWQGGNASMIYKMPDTENAPLDLNIKFSYWGSGQNMFRFTNSSGDQWLCKMFLQDGQLYWGDSANNYTGTVIKDWVTPYTEHLLTLSISDGAVAVFLDNEFLHLGTPFSSGFGNDFPKSLYFYNTEQKITAGNDVANRFMFAGISIKEITTDAELKMNEIGQNSVSLAFADADGNPVTEIHPDKNPAVISGNANIVNLSNAPISGKVLLAKYINDMLVDVRISEEFSIPAKTVGKSETLSISSDEIEIGAKYKMCAYDSFNVLRPLCKSCVLEQPLKIAEEMHGESYVSEEMWNLTRIAKTIDKANKGGNIVVAALGGSITEGAGASIKANSYAARVADWWEEKYPGQVTYVNAGVGGTDSFLGVHRMPSQILAYNPDFVVVDFAVNDNAYPVQDFAYETIIREILSSSDTASVMMAFFMNNSSGTSLTNAQNLEIPIGEYYGVPMISVLNALKAQKDKGNLEYKNVMADTVHPNDLGHWLASSCITSVLDNVYDNIGSYKDGTYAIPAETHFKPQKYRNGKIYVADNQDGKKLGLSLAPAANEGWTGDFEIDYCPSWSNNYGYGWKATEYGASMSFKVTGKYISLLYRGFKEDKSGIVKVVIDGNESKPIYIDSYTSSFVTVRNDLGQINIELPDLENSEHTVSLELIYPGEYDASITRTGNFFGLCGIMVSE